MNISLSFKSPLKFELYWSLFKLVLCAQPNITHVVRRITDSPRFASLFFADSNKHIQSWTNSMKIYCVLVGQAWWEVFYQPLICTSAAQFSATRALHMFEYMMQCSEIPHTCFIKRYEQHKMLINVGHPSILPCNCHLVYPVRP